MNNPIIKIHNSTTNEVLEREMTDSEYAQYLKDATEIEAQANAKTARDAQRQILLDRLGITADEAQLLLGGN